MARQESLIQWASSSRHRICLDAKEFDWAWKNGIQLFDFEVCLKIDGFTGVGRGSDSSETRALEKAISEAIERAVCASLRIPSVGVACHTNARYASENACLEALERYTFEKHIRESINFCPVQIEANPLAAAIPDARFFSMSVPDPFKGMICFHSEGNEKFIGLGCDMDPRKAAGKAALEVLRNCAAFRDDPKSFQEIVGRDPNFWCCDSKVLSSIERLLTIDIPTPAESHSNVTLNTEKIDLSHLPSLADCPAFVARSTVIGESP